jgi:hypothetical protein
MVMKKRIMRKWDEEIEKLNGTKSGKRKFLFKTPGSASVTRVRLLREFSGLYGSTSGKVMTLSLNPL